LNIKCFTVNGVDGPYVTIKSLNEFLVAFGVDVMRYSDDKMHTGSILTRVRKQLSPEKMNYYHADASCLSYILMQRDLPNELINKLLLHDLITLNSIKLKTFGEESKWVQVVKLPLLKIFFSYIGLNSNEYNLIGYDILDMNVSNYKIEPFTFNEETKKYPLFPVKKEEKHSRHHMGVLSLMTDEEQEVVRKYTRMCKENR